MSNEKILKSKSKSRKSVSDDRSDKSDDGVVKYEYLTSKDQANKLIGKEKKKKLINKMVKLSPRLAKISGTSTIMHGDHQNPYTDSWPKRDSKGIINQLTKKNIYDVIQSSKIDAPPKDVVLATMLLIGETPHVQVAIDVMKDQDFIFKLKCVHAADLSPNTYSRVLTLSQNPKFTNQWSAKFTPGFGILTEWVLALLKEYQSI